MVLGALFLVSPRASKFTGPALNVKPKYNVTRSLIRKDTSSMDRYYNINAEEKMSPHSQSCSVSRFHVAFSPTISAGGGGARGENATHGVVLAPWAGVFADDSSHRSPYLVLLYVTKDEFARIMAQLEIQLDKEEIHECDFKKCFTQPKKKFEKFLYLKPKEDFSECDGNAFQSYSGYSIQEFKDWIVCYLTGIEKGIDTRVPHDEVLRIKERDVNERKKKERHMIELEMLKLEKNVSKGRMQQNRECSTSKTIKKIKEFNEEIAMVVLKVLKNQLQQFITMQISVDSVDQKTNHFFTEYTLCDAQMFQNILISLMDSIEKAIADN
nr:hypothetical protein [Tanacetum cinerariifolium]